MKTFSLALTAALSALVGLLFAAPAQATSNTTLSFNHTTSSSYQDDTEVMVDGNTDPSFTKSVAGCRASFTNGVPNNVYPVSSLDNGRVYLYNSKATPATYTERFYLDSDCTGVDFSTPATASASITVEPELKISTVTLAANSERTQPVAFTTYAWNFGYGSSFSLATAHDCDPSSTLSGDLPDGITISETAYAGGVIPKLILHGSSHASGSYIVCTKLGLGYGQQYAWMHLTVGNGPQLASTGTDNRVIIFTGLGSLGVVALAILGVWLSSRRRRS